MIFYIKVSPLFNSFSIKVVIFDARKIIVIGNNDFNSNEDIEKAEINSRWVLGKTSENIFIVDLKGVFRMLLV